MVWGNPCESILPFSKGPRQVENHGLLSASLREQVTAACFGLALCLSLLPANMNANRARDLQAKLLPPPALGRSITKTLLSLRQGSWGSKKARDEVSKAYGLGVFQGLESVLPFVIWWYVSPVSSYTLWTAGTGLLETLQNHAWGPGILLLPACCVPSMVHQAALRWDLHHSPG